ncbi:hypothetical protein ACWPKO_04065 [Coraliomargarita sp. W4R53]
MLDRIYLATKNRSQQAALIADSFFSHPQLGRYREFLKASKALKVSKAVDTWVRHFLETGEEPNESSVRKGKQSTCPPWPLDPLEAPNQERYTYRKFPMFDVLIDLAILEKKPDEVLRWYDAQVAGGVKSYGYGGRSQGVADAVQAVYPERSIEIWKRIAEGNINQVNVKGYEAAVPYLKKIKSCMKRHGMGGQWQSYLQQLCDQNRRRPRCVQILKRLEQAGQPIVGL